jgi:HAD superfamily hydrolase (TIGR01509 family)
MALKAVFFDFDGLLADTEPAYYSACSSVMAECGVTVTREEYAARWIVRGTKASEELPRLGVKMDPEAWVAEVRKRFRAIIARELKAMPHALEALSAAKARFATAVVTNTPHGDVEPMLERLGMAKLLDHVVAREDYERSKPDGDCYLAACRMARFEPRECLALEDASRGVRAASAAGVPVIAVLNEWTKSVIPPEAFLVLDGLNELDLAKVASVWPPKVHTAATW